MAIFSFSITNSEIVASKSNFVFFFEVLGMILGGFEGYVISVSLLSSPFDLGNLAASLFFVILLGATNGKMYLLLLGIPVGFCIGYFLKKPKLGIEIGTIGGMIVGMPIFLESQLFEFLFFTSYLSMIIGIFAGKFAGIKIGKYFNKENEVKINEN